MKNLLSNRQLYMIGIILSVNSNVLIAPKLVIGSAKNSAWLSYLIAAAIVLIPLWMLTAITKRFPNQDIFQSMITRSAIIGKSITFLYSLFFLVILDRDLHILDQFVQIVLLPNTPRIITTGMIVFTAVVIARGGLEILGRMSEIFVPIFLVLTFTMPVFIFNNIHLNQLTPVLGEGVLPVIQGSWYLIGLIGEILIVPFIVSDQKYDPKIGYKGLLTTLVVLLLFNMYTVLMLGVHVPRRSVFPIYEMVQEIRLSDFLDRLDLPLTAVWFPTMIIKISIDLYIMIHAFMRIFPKMKPEMMSTPFGILGLTTSFLLFSNIIEVINFNEIYTLFALVPEYLIPFGLFLFLRPQKNRPASKTGSARN